MLGRGIKMRTKLTYRATRLFGSLRCATPMAIVNHFVPSTRDNDEFIDGYVLCAPCLPLLLVTLYPYIPHLGFVWPLAVWRIFEIIIALLNTLLFDEYPAVLGFKSPKPLAGLRRPLILLAFTYTELALWFAFIYRFLIAALQQPTFSAWIGAVNLSFLRISAFGSSSIEVETPLVIAIMLAESAIGLFMALAAISRFVSLIPERKSADAVERRINR
jgi:hypothetical protein